MREGTDSRTKVVLFQNEMGVESSRAPQRGKAPANLWASVRGASLTFLPHSLPLAISHPLTHFLPPSPRLLVPIRSDRWPHCRSSGLGVRKFSSFSERNCNFHHDEKSNNIFAHPLQLAIEEVWAQTAVYSPSALVGGGKVTSAPIRQKKTSTFRYSSEYEICQGQTNDLMNISGCEMTSETSRFQ